MRVTRASTSLSKARNNKRTKALASDPGSSGDEIGDVEDHLARAQKGVQTLLKQLQSVRETNAELTAELESLRNSNDAPKDGSSKATLRARVKTLESEVRRLEKAREKDKDKIKSYKTREIKREADDLGDPAVLSADLNDTAHDMRELLRRFHDLMTINVLDINEECPICFDGLKLDQCSSFPCQHLVCNNCLPQVCKVDWDSKERSEGERGEEVTKCPQCRQIAPRDELEIVHRTANQQWDELLELAEEWAKMDRQRRAAETDEEDDEEFINDDSTHASSSAQSEAPSVSKESNPESDMSVDRAVTPPEPNGARRYLDSPSRAKRKRMEELAEQRRKKKRL